jgi:hypothetical protein
MGVVSFMLYLPTISTTRLGQPQSRSGYGVEDKNDYYCQECFSHLPPVIGHFVGLRPDLDTVMKIKCLLLPGSLY